MAVEAPVKLVRRSAVPNFLERRAWVYYDTVTIPAAAPPTEYIFFRDIQGKTPQQTNMRLSSQIPFPQVFSVASVQVAPPMGTGLAGPVVPLSGANWNAISRGRVDFEVGNTNAFESFMTQLPAGGGVFGAVALKSLAATEFEFIQNGMPSPTLAHRFAVKVRLVHGENFLIRLRYVTAPVVTVDLPVMIKIVGILGRGIQ